MKITRKALRKILLEIFPKPDEKLLGDVTDYASDTGDSDAEKREMFSIYSDVYKEKYGIRPRFVDLQALSVDQLQGMLDRLYDQPDFLDDYNDYEHEEPGETYPDMEGTVDDPLPASVRSGGYVRNLGDDEGPTERPTKAWRNRDGDVRSTGQWGIADAVRKLRR